MRNGIGLMYPTFTPKPEWLEIFMRYHIWDRESGKLLATCEYKQSAYDFRAIEAEKTGKPKSAFRISYELSE